MRYKEICKGSSHRIATGILGIMTIALGLGIGLRQATAQEPDPTTQVENNCAGLDDPSPICNPPCVDGIEICLQLTNCHPNPDWPGECSCDTNLTSISC